MAAICLKRIIILCFVTIVFLFLLNTFILYSYQETFVKENRKDNLDVPGRPRDKYIVETEAETKYRELSKHEVKIGQETAGKDTLSFSNGRPRTENIHSHTSKETFNHKEVSKPAEGKEKAAVESDSKPVEPVEIKRDLVTTVSDQSQEWNLDGSYETQTLVTTKTAPAKKRKGKQTKEEKERREKDGYGKHSFNQTASDIIPLNRSIPDTRGPRLVYITNNGLTDFASLCIKYRFDRFDL